MTYTKIFSPIDGIVVSQAVREGETLNANQVTPTVVQVADLNTMTARAQVAEADITRLYQGMEVYFNTLGSRGRKWSGKIRQILPIPEIINDVVLYNVLVDVENKDRRLLPQMSAQMFFVMGGVEQVPLVPVAAAGLSDPSSTLLTAISAVTAPFPLELLSRRPENAASEARLGAANASIDIARAAFLPSFDIRAGWSLTGSNIGNRDF